MKVQEVIMRAMAKQITWWQAAEILGVSTKTIRRRRREWQKMGFDGLYDRRWKRPSPKQVPVKELEKILDREKYSDFNVRHFHEKLGEEHGIHYSYTWVKNALQASGLIPVRHKRGPHRRRRPRRPIPGMLLHIDGSQHRWFQDERQLDLIVILDDATSEIYYAQLVDQESTRTVLAAIRHVVETKGWFSCLYSDRASHFFRTPKAGGPVDARERTEVGRALMPLGGTVTRHPRSDFLAAQTRERIAADSAEFAKLQAEFSQAVGKAKTRLKTKIDAARERLQFKRNVFQEKIEHVKQS